ncbi:MAG: hypothetical protein MMC23_002071 [Stictis urceolatum]|nr:hypothetical protein [Stictis urceolata]
MPASPPPPRRKSCDACIRAKRRCNQDLPKCSRCVSKDVECRYTSLGNFAGQVQAKRPSAAIARHNHDMTGVVDLGQFDFNNLDFVLPHNGGEFHVSPDIQPDPVWVPVDTAIPDTARLEFISKQLKSLSKNFLDTGSLHFIHPKLWEADYPISIQEAFCACSVYHARNSDNCNLALSTIGAKAQQIIGYGSDPSSTVRDKLAHIQALVVVQSIRLFDGDIRQRALAEGDQNVLYTWMKELHEMSQGRIAIESSPWRNWLLKESINRTIIVAGIIQGVYSVAKYGNCPTSDFVKTLPFTPTSNYWATKSSYEWERAQALDDPSWFQETSLNTILQTYTKKPKLDDFGDMLLGINFGPDAIYRWRDGCKSLFEGSSGGTSIICSS